MPATCVGGRDATGMANVATGPRGAGETFRRQGDSTGVEIRLLKQPGEHRAQMDHSAG